MPGNGLSASARSLARTPVGTSATSAPSFRFISALSFADQRHGWAVGHLACPVTAKLCQDQLILRQTSDGGITWQPRSLPTGLPPTGSSLLFVTPRDGWLYGPGLFVTHDGGKTWRRDGHHGTILARARWGGRVWSIEQSCTARCVVSLRSSADLGRTWQLAARPAYTGMTAVGGHLYLYQYAQLTGLDPSTAWLRLTLSSFRTVILVTRDGAATWQHVTDPCSGLRNSLIAALPPRRLWSLCGGEMGAGNEGKALFVSQDGGQHWQEVAQTPDGWLGSQFPCTTGCGALPSAGYITQLLVTTPQRGWFTADRGNLEGTWNGGHTWREPLPALEGYAGAGFSEPVTFVDPLHGWLAAGCTVFRTSDGGLHWRSATLSRICSL
jgi:photosystem II stability/assembly factor-like uncharacterized protein